VLGALVVLSPSLSFANSPRSLANNFRIDNAEEHYQTLLQASPEPHVLDDYTVGRVFEVFGSQKDDLWLFEEQLARWKMDKLSIGQRHEVDRLTEQVGRCRTVIDSILSLAEQLKEGTIEKVLAKSDLELGLEFLLNKRKATALKPDQAREFSLLI
jgi:hypothetical protein